MNNAEEVRNYVQKLREIADFYEQHPQVKLPFEGTVTNFGIYGASKEEIIEGVKAFGGTTEKDFHDDVVTFSKTFPSGVRLYFYTPRETVCERVVVGTRVLPSVIIPAKEEEVLPERVENIVEWRCGSLLKEASAVGVAG